MIGNWILYTMFWSFSQLTFSPFFLFKYVLGTKRRVRIPCFELFHNSTSVFLKLFLGTKWRVRILFIYFFWWVRVRILIFGILLGLIGKLVFLDSFGSWGWKILKFEILGFYFFFFFAHKLICSLISVG